MWAHLRTFLSKFVLAMDGLFAVLRLTWYFDTADNRRVRFKSDEVEASPEQILGAMGKIASHIGNPGKFSKASKLALQLLQAGNVKSDTADAFFEIVRGAMTVPSQAIDSKLWMDYHSLFSAVLDKREVC